MAFIFKQKGSKNWIAGFRDVTGKRRNRSTALENTEANRFAATDIARAYEAAATRKRSAQQVRRVISHFHKELTGEDLPVVTVRSHLETWLKSKKPTISRATQVFYNTSTKKFLAHLGDRADIDLVDVSREDIEGFRDTLAETLAPKTVNHHLKTLKAIFRDARDRVILVDDPTEFVKIVKDTKKGEKSRRPFTMEEIEKILEHCDDEWRSMVTFGLYTGQRLGDLASLRWSSVDLKKKTLTLTTAKTGKTLSIPIHPHFLKHIKSLPSPVSGDLPIHPEAFVTKEAEGKTSSLSNRFTAILVDAGLREKKSHKSTGKGRSGRRTIYPLSFHCLRHTAVSMLHEADVRPSVIMELVGHDSVAIHAQYITSSDEARRDGIAKIPSIG